MSVGLLPYFEVIICQRFGLMRTTEHIKAHYQSYPYETVVNWQSNSVRNICYCNMKNKYYNHKVKCYETHLP
jgi:hypothetical protein